MFSNMGDEECFFTESKVFSMKFICFILVCLLFVFTAASVNAQGPCAPVTTYAPPACGPIMQSPGCNTVLQSPGACDTVRTLHTVRERIHPIATIAVATVDRLAEVRQNVHARVDDRIEHRVQLRHTIHTTQCTSTVKACSPVIMMAPPACGPVMNAPTPPVCGPARCND